VNTNQRIAQARKNKGYSQAKLAELVGVSRGSCAHWEQAISIPSMENMSRLAVTLEVSFEWLSTGRGEEHYPKHRTGVSEPRASYGPESDYIPKDQQEIIQIFRSLDLDSQELALQLLRRMNKSSAISYNAPTDESAATVSES
jgi:transcriptional regulator with XRE-family HTH domain